MLHFSHPAMKIHVCIHMCRVLMLTPGEASRDFRAQQYSLCDEDILCIKEKNITDQGSTHRGPCEPKGRKCNTRNPFYDERRSRLIFFRISHAECPVFGRYANPHKREYSLGGRFCCRAVTLFMKKTSKPLQTEVGLVISRSQRELILRL